MLHRTILHGPKSTDGAEISASAKEKFETVKRQIVQKILGNMITPNVICLKGFTPLALAVMQDNLPLVEILLEADASIDYEVQKCYKPTLQLAILAAHSSATKQQGRGEELQWEQHGKIFFKLLDNLGTYLNLSSPDTTDPEYGWTAMHQAVSVNAYPFVERLIQKKANINL